MNHLYHDIRRIKVFLYTLLWTLTMYILVLLVVPEHINEYRHWNRDLSCWLCLCTLMNTDTVKQWFMCTAVCVWALWWIQTHWSSDLLCYLYWWLCLSTLMNIDTLKWHTKKILDAVTYLYCWLCLSTLMQRPSVRSDVLMLPASFTLSPILCVLA